MAPLEPWEKVLVDADTFLPSIHGKIACQECHLGDPSVNEKDAAHVGIVSRPSEDYSALCSSCHSEITEIFGDSLHLSQAGYWEALDTRAGTVEHPELDEMFGNHCASCHTTCGDCHISQPLSVGGGFIDGHNFNQTPSLTRNCTACHGSRVGNEYMGKNEDVKADVHFRQARMSCVDCHTGEQMHTQNSECTECHDESQAAMVDVPNSRYDGPADVACGDCHPEALNGIDNNAMHSQHGGQLQCQVCHAVSYTSCDSCHVSISEETGKPKFATSGTYSTFLIGKNPLQNYHRPESYAVVRHVPVDTESFAFYGEGLLTNFNSLPTWVYATPHNIQLSTPQNESCAACHGNAEFFLTADKVKKEEFEANKNVIVEEVPNPFGSP